MYFLIFLYKFTQIKIKIFECPKSIRNYKKDNAWNIRGLVNESFVQVNQRTSILYCRLLDFRLVFQVNWSSCLVDFTVDVSESAPSLPMLTLGMSSIDSH